MNIKSAKYINFKNVSNNKTIKLITNADEELYVPVDINNRHYIEIQEWVAAGNTIEEAD
tara:strand:- start:185 stop:361 length:177 start_codon:yes stop_codon:yes gene_type:complete